jgi:DNA gyrase subunit A
LFATPRRTEITESDADFEDEDLIQREDMVVTVSHAGYIKRVPLSTYRAQRRGGKGRSGMSTRDEDFVTRIFVASTHTPVLFFSSERAGLSRKGLAFAPVCAPGARQGAGEHSAAQSQGERITSILPLPEDEDSWANLDVVFCTNVGSVRRNKLSDFQRINRNGKIAMKLDEGMSILSVDVCTDQDDLLLTTAMGQAIRFPVGDLRVFQSRDSTGVRGINLAEGDEVIGMSVLRHYDATPAQRAAYIKRRRLMEGEVDDACRWRMKIRLTGSARTDRGRLRGHVGSRRVHPCDLREGLWQAVLELRVPCLRTWRQRDHCHGGHASATDRSWLPSRSSTPTRS